jgi:hypothetical protein
MSRLLSPNFRDLTNELRFVEVKRLYEEFIFQKKCLNEDSCSQVHRNAYIDYPSTLIALYDWIGKYVVTSSLSELQKFLPLLSNRIVWPVPGTTTTRSSSKPNRIVIAYVPGAPWQWEIELDESQADKVWTVNPEADDSYAFEAETNVCRLQDFVVTCLLWDLISNAPCKFQSDFTAAHFVTTKEYERCLWDSNHLPGRRLQVFEWNGVLVAKDGDVFQFGTNDAGAEALLQLRGPVSALTIMFRTRKRRLVDCEIFEIKIKRIQGDGNSGVVCIEVGQLTRYRFWQQLGESVEFDELLAAFVRATQEPSYGSHVINYEGESTSESQRTSQSQAVVSFVESVIERIDPRFQEQCRNIVSSDQC